MEIEQMMVEFACSSSRGEEKISEYLTLVGVLERLGELLSVQHVLQLIGHQHRLQVDFSLLLRLDHDFPCLLNLN